jgi:Tfp pilus assembly protein PilO
LKQNVQKVKLILPKVTEAGEEKKLFKLISQMAEKNALNLKQINKQNAPVTEADKQQQQKFQESPLTLEIDGKFADYLAFKRDMFEEKPVLRIDTEVIQLNKISETNTLIGIAIRLTDFVINKQEFQRIINKYEKAS